MKRTSKNILKNLNMIFIPSIVGRILGWPQDFISLMYMLYINPSSRGWAGPVNMMGCHSKDYMKKDFADVIKNPNQLTKRLLWVGLT